MSQENSKSESEWRERIVIDPHVHHGDPCIQRTRIPVSIIVSSIADGDTPDDVIRSIHN